MSPTQDEDLEEEEEEEDEEHFLTQVSCSPQMQPRGLVSLAVPSGLIPVVWNPLWVVLLQAQAQGLCGDVCPRSLSLPRPPCCLEHTSYPVRLGSSRMTVPLLGSVSLLLGQASEHALSLVGTTCPF